VINVPKKIIQSVLTVKCHHNYHTQIKKQTVPYGAWTKEWMEQKIAEVKRYAEGKILPNVIQISYAELKDKNSLSELLQSNSGEIVLFTADPEKMIPEAKKITAAYFDSHPDCQIAYPDEINWLKPDWSPDMLLSFFYFGNIFAVRRDCLIETLEKLNQDYTDVKQFLYQLVLCCIDRAGSACHMEYVLYCGPKTKVWGTEEEFASLKQGHMISDPELKEQSKMVSIIILSKDHPRLLSHCIHSIREFTEYQNLEIIVLDNGSSPENKARIEKIHEQMSRTVSFRYIYQKMEFNFSRLCNIGAAYAGGEYLLFLNDDTEVVQPEWLTRMLEKASKQYVGAVGIKLLYPDGDTIQHTGVTNIHLGPAHKLQMALDQKDHYHGWNKAAVNVSAVTGACLLMRREVFEQAGGWNENLEVAFNDVEICYRIRKAGYANVCCNNTWMIHHESMSRGMDAGKKKLDRLHQERDILYSAHPDMWNADPYYNHAMNRDIMDREFLTGNRYSEKRCSRFVIPHKILGRIPEAWHNEVLRSGVEFAGDAQLWYSGRSGRGNYYIQGWYYALQVDNSRYNISILLRKIADGEEISGYTQSTAGEMWKIPVNRCYRPDHEEALSHISYPGLSGAGIWFSRTALPEGEYLIGYLWEDTCSRQKMYDLTAETLTVIHGEKNES